MRETLFLEHICTVYKMSGLKNHKKVTVVVNCRTGYKLEYYQQKPKRF